MGGRRARVVIAGGGIAGLETLLALRALAGHQCELTLLAPEREFVYQAVTVGEAFDRAEAHVYPLAGIASEQGATLVADSLTAVDGGRVVTAAGDRIEFDQLVVATGARGREPFPEALTFGGREDVAALRRLLDELVRREARSVAFALPSEGIWPLPLYELALMTADHLRARDAGDVAVSVVTPEAKPLELFGPAAATAVEELLDARAIALHTRSLPTAVHRRVLRLGGKGAMLVDRVITLPVPEGPSLPGLPHDEQGFLPVDAHGRVAGAERVLAAGDVTAFPLKQGGLAAQQADAVAEAIAAEIGAAVTPRPFTPVLRGLLMTNGPPLYLRARMQRKSARTSVAVEAIELDRAAGDAVVARGQPLWWPPAKIAGRYLASYLASGRAEPLSSEPLFDRMPIPDFGPAEAEQEEALDLTLMMADLDARWGDYRSALDALDAAEALQGALAPEYEARRRKWREAEIAAG
jgi:sulfide:quinone oxidoreductase